MVNLSLSQFSLSWTWSLLEYCFAKFKHARAHPDWVGNLRVAVAVKRTAYMLVFLFPKLNDYNPYLKPLFFIASCVHYCLSLITALGD